MLAHEANTARKLSGARLVLARSVCVALIGFSLTVFIADLPGYFARLQLVCESSDCALWQLTPTSVLQLQQIGLTVGSYAAFGIALSVFAVFFWSLVGVFIAWRKFNDWMAFLVAILLVTTGIVGQSVPDFSHLSIALVASSSPWFVPTMVIAFLVTFLFLFTFLLFPDGRFVPRWTRWLPVVGIALAGGVAILFLLQIHFFQWLNPLIWVIIVAMEAPGVFAQLYRYRYVSTPTQRQQTKWIVLGAIGGEPGSVEGGIGSRGAGDHAALTCLALVAPNCIREERSGDLEQEESRSLNVPVELRGKRTGCVHSELSHEQ